MAEIKFFGDIDLEHGERYVCDFLRDNLSADFKVFVQLPLGRKRNGSLRGTKRPDFIVFNPEIGIWVLEVKNWLPETIVRFNKTKVVLNLQNAEGIRERKENKNPYLQAQEYVPCIKAEFRLYGNELTRHCGTPSVPYGWGVIFVHRSLKRADFIEYGHTKNVEFGRTLFRDELDGARGSDFSKHLERWLEPSQSVPHIDTTKMLDQPDNIDVSAIESTIDTGLPPLLQNTSQRTGWGRIAVLGLSVLITLGAVLNRKSEEGPKPELHTDVIETVNGTCLNVREFPTATSSITNVAPYGTRVRIAGTAQNGWKEIESEITVSPACKSRSNKIHGYVNPQYLSPTQ